MLIKDYEPSQSASLSNLCAQKQLDVGFTEHVVLPCWKDLIPVPDIKWVLGHFLFLLSVLPYNFIYFKNIDRYRLVGMTKDLQTKEKKVDKEERMKRR